MARTLASAASAASESKKPFLFPNGRYVVRVDHLEVAPSQIDGSEQIRYTLTILTAPANFKGRRMSIYRPTHDKADILLQRDMQAARFSRDTALPEPNAPASEWLALLMPMLGVEYVLSVSTRGYKSKAGEDKEENEYAFVCPAEIHAGAALPVDDHVEAEVEAEAEQAAEPVLA